MVEECPRPLPHTRQVWNPRVVGEEARRGPTRGCEFPYSPTFWEGNLQMGNSPVFRGIWGILFRFSFFLFVCSFFLLSVTVVRSIPSPCFLVPGLTFAYERHC